MRKKYLYTCLLSLIIIVFSIIMINKTNWLNTLTHSLSEREKFESYLVSSYRSIPELNNPVSDEKNLDKPELAAIHDYYMTVDPYTKTVPRERLITAYNKLIELNKEKELKSTPLQWENVPVEMGGRTRMIMYDPNDPQRKKVWAGGVTGGLWYNNDITNVNSSWNAVNDFWDGLSISSMAYDPNNTQIMYIGTGEAQTAMITYRSSSAKGLGIWKSTNGGVNWQLIPSTSNFPFITDIKVRNESGTSAIYAGVVSGIYEGQHQANPSDGLYRSTNGGSSWTQVLPIISGQTVPYSPADIDIAADGRIYIGTMPNINNQGAAIVLYSDTGLPGSWTVFNDYVAIIQGQPQYNIPGRTIVACAPSNPNVVYSIISSGYINSSNGFKYYQARHILKSTNRGATWALKTYPTANWASIPWHALSAAVDPNHPDSLYIGGLDVYKTVTGGTNWLPRLSDWDDMYSGGGPRYIHADIHAIVFKPGSSSEMVFGSDGGIFFTSSGNLAQPTFEQHNKNYNTLQFYVGAINPGSGISNYLGGLQDNGTLLYQGTPLTINDMIDGGDGAYCFWDQTEANIYITSVYYNAYSIWYNGNPLNANFNSGTFISPADYDYNTNKLYANAVNYVISTPNRILRISNIPSGNNGTYLTLATSSNVPFSFVKYSPYSPTGTSTIFLGTQSGRLFKVTNAESTPVVTEIGSSSFPPANLSSIAIGSSENQLIATFSNFGVPSVWYTTNGGTNWTNVEGNLPDMPVRWVLFSPNDPAYVMLATEIGIWTTDNINAPSVNWIPNNSGLANVRIDMLTYRNSDKKILAATHGRGLYTTVFNPIGINENSVSNIKVFPNPSNSGKYTIQLNEKGGNMNIMVTDLKGSVVIPDKTINSADNSVVIDISSHSKGAYLLIYSDGKRKIVKQLIYN